MVTLHKKTQTQVMCTERRRMIVGLTLWPHGFHPWCVAPLPSAPAGSPLSASSGPHLCPGADSVQNISINMVYFAADSVQIIHSINMVYTGADSVQNILLLFFYFLFFPNFLQLYCPNGISSMGNLGCCPQGKPAVTVTLPNLLCMLGIFVPP